MPLSIEQESEDLLRKALERLRNQMDPSGGYAQIEELPFDQLDRVLGLALERGAQGGGYASGIREAKNISPDLFSLLLGRDSERLENLNYAPAPGRGTSDLSGPIQLPGGELGRVLGTQWLPVRRQPEVQPRQVLPQWAIPSTKGDPGFSYMAPGGSAEGELAARDIWRTSDEGIAAKEAAYALGLQNDANAVFNSMIAPGAPVMGRTAGDDEAFQGALEFLAREFESGKSGTDIVRSLPPAISSRLTTAQLNALIRMATTREPSNDMGLFKPAPTGANRLPSGSAVAPSQSERVIVTSPDGKRGSIPRSQLEEALKAGYRQQ